MNDDVARELVAAVNGLTAALQGRWAQEDARLTGQQRAAESEELNFLRAAHSAALAKADQLRDRTRSAEAIAEAVTQERDQLADQLRSAADLTDITLTTERTI